MFLKKTDAPLHNTVECSASETCPLRWQEWLLTLFFYIILSTITIIIIIIIIISSVFSSIVIHILSW